MPAAEPSVPAPASSDPTPLDVSEAATDADVDGEPSGPEPDWKPEYEANLARWRAEADVARAKAEATRERLAKEREAEAKPGSDAAEAERRAAKEKEEAEERARRLAAALEDSAPSSASGSRILPSAGENKQLKEAWEHLSTPRGAPGPLASGSQPASAPTTSAPPSTSWEEVSAPSGPQSSDTSSDNLPSKRQTEKAFEDTTGMPVVSSANPSSASPSVPQPSLTLSIFTRPGSLTLSRVVAALGINLVLPFINGVFLGLGEIFAREAVRVGRIWWKQERTRDTRTTRDTGKGWSASDGRGRGIPGVGLSGAGGF